MLLIRINLLKNHLITIKGSYAKTIIEIKNSASYPDKLVDFVDEIKKQGYEPVGELYGVARYVSLYDGETDLYEFIIEVK